MPKARAEQLLAGLASSLATPEEPEAEKQDSGNGGGSGESDSPTTPHEPSLRQDFGVTKTKKPFVGKSKGKTKVELDVVACNSDTLGLVDRTCEVPVGGDALLPTLSPAAAENGPFKSTNTQTVSFRRRLTRR